MRPHAATIVLFLSIAANAAGQVVIGDHELTYGPFTPGPDHSFALAVASHGLLLAWSEQDPGTKVATIHTGLLDFDAQLAGEIHTIPTNLPKMHATTPAVATDGNAFFVAWLERQRYSNQSAVAGVLTDSTGQPAGPSQSFGAAVTGSPALIFDGLGYRLYGGESYFITPDGTRGGNNGEAVRRVPFATPDANGWIDWSIVPGRPICFSFCGGLPPQPPSHNIDWAILTTDWIRAGRYTDRDTTAGAPVVIAHERDLLNVWSTGTGLKALRVVDGVAGAEFTLADDRASQTSPAMSESLVVFDKLGDVYGSVITGNAFGPVFPISAGDAEWDGQARAYLIGENRYLVTYVREGDGDDVTIVGRFITTE